MKGLNRAAVLVAATVAVSACAGGHSASVTATLTAPRASIQTPIPSIERRIAAQARSTARSLGDPSVKTAQVYGPDSRYLLVKASSGDLVQKLARERNGFYLIVLHGRFVCNSCSRPPGAKPQRGTIATNVWSPTAGGTDFGLSSSLPAAMSRLKSPTVISLAEPARQQG